MSAVVGTGSAVANAKLYVKGGDLLVYTLLMTGASPNGAQTLEDSTPTASGTIEDIYLKLDAAAVQPGAAGLNTAWTYTLTYTLSE